MSVIDETIVQHVPGRLLHFPEDAPALRRVAVPVPDSEFGGDKLRDLTRVLGVTMLSNRGAGLAATQLDVEPCWRVIVIGEGNVWIPLCNPEIIRRWGTQTGDEGCLSFASVGERLEALAHLVVKYRNPDGKAEEVDCDGFRARAVSHEVQHLDGYLLIDRMGTLQRKMFLDRVTKVRKQRAPS